MTLLQRVLEMQFRDCIVKKCTESDYFLILLRQLLNPERPDLHEGALRELRLHYAEEYNAAHGVPTLDTGDEW